MHVSKDQDSVTANIFNGYCRVKVLALQQQRVITHFQLVVKEKMVGQVRMIQRGLIFKFYTHFSLVTLHLAEIVANQ